MLKKLSNTKFNIYSQEEKKGNFVVSNIFLFI